MSWDQGRDDLEEMLNSNRLQRVTASREHADRLLRQARQHLASAASIAEHDPEGAYALQYDAARKALWAILENQGLRPIANGGHATAFHAVLAQLHPPLGAELRPFDRMRRNRNTSEYPPVDAPELTPDDVTDDAPKVEAIINIAERVLDSMPVF